ncbi:MAG TPA: fumarylacetoacetate hydrolase family protein [Pyrinomonadaceae bacterium]|jgi:2-keto-4-pentenoate hydratase/2-oxohepta-3-ene-1,7-dioic acid hydratase in catechol pathway
MKICRFSHNNTEYGGAYRDGLVYSFGDKTLAEDFAFERVEHRFEIEAVKLLPPVSPSKIVCVGRNYAAHAAELGNDVPKAPLLFLKAPSSVITDGEPIIIPEQSAQVEHEGELGVVIGRKCRKLSETENPFPYVLGYICLNDVTARDVQRADVQFTRGKSFDTFCPVGSVIETDLDVSDIRVQTRVNGIIKQDGRTSQMVFPVDFLIRYISNQMTLLPGDVIATGTPSGVSKLNPGDVCEVVIEGIGILSNPVSA